MAERSNIEPSDAEVSEFVAQYPSGAPLEVVAPHFSLTKERVRQLERRALRRLAVVLVALNIGQTDDMI